MPWLPSTILLAAMKAMMSPPSAADANSPKYSVRELVM